MASSQNSIHILQDQVSCIIEQVKVQIETKQRRSIYGLQEAEHGRNWSVVHKCPFNYTFSAGFTVTTHLVGCHQPIRKRDTVRQKLVNDAAMEPTIR